jgi:hypothetical protein
MKLAEQLGYLLRCPAKFPFYLKHTLIRLVFLQAGFESEPVV